MKLIIFVLLLCLSKNAFAVHKFNNGCQNGQYIATQTPEFDSTADIVEKIDNVWTGTIVGTNGEGSGNMPIIYGANAKPAFADLNYTGHVDMVVRSSTKALTFYGNDGNGLINSFNEETNVPFPIIVNDGGDINAAPAFADLNNDGKIDMIMGKSDGSLSYYQSQSAVDGTLVPRTDTANPFDGIDVGTLSAPALADIDNDGDVDLIVGASDSKIYYYENTGSNTFTARTGATDNPFDSITGSAPTFADLDNDDDFDLIVGQSDGTIKYYENTGSVTSPTFTARTGTDNLFDGIDVGVNAAPGFIDLDNDGALDLVVGAGDGKISTYTNIGTFTCALWTVPTSYTDGECIASCVGKVCTCVKPATTPTCAVNEVQTASGCSKITTDIKAAFVAQGHCVG